MDGRPRIARLFVFLLPTLLLSTHLQAQPARDEIRVARLIEDLGSRKYAQREQATEALQAAGDDVREQLERAARSDNPEVRLRAKNLLHKLQLDDLWQAGQVTLPVTKADASDMILAIAEQTGNRIYLGDNYGSFADGPVELPRTGQMWPLLDTLCRQSGNRVRPHYGLNRDGLVVVAGTLGDYPVAYRGPIRVQVTTAKRDFSEKLDYENGKSKIDHQFQLNLLMTWEDRFRLVAARAHVDLIEAVTESGEQVKAVRAGNSNWNVFDDSSRQYSAVLNLQPPSANAKRLKHLVLEWDAIAIGQIAKLPIHPLETHRPYRQDDATVVIQTIEQLDGSRWQLEFSVARELPIPEPQDVLQRENTFELLDQHGMLMPQQGRSQTSIAQGIARYELTFQGESAESKPTKLIVHYPQLRDRRRVRIEFQDVPLPTAKPE